MRSPGSSSPGSSSPGSPSPSVLVPVVAVVDRLRTRARLTTLVALLVLPSLFATWSFASVLGGQVDFAASERTGVTVVRPALVALADTAAGRTADLAPLHEAVREHPELGADEALEAVVAAAGAADPAMRAATAQALASLITVVGDSSKLILDPDLDSFYVMDVLVVQLPKALTATAQTAVAAGPAGPETELVASRAVLAGALTGAAAAVRGDLETAERNTSSASLRDSTATAVPGAVAVEALAERISTALADPTPQEAATRTEVGDAALAAVGPLTGALDELLETRRAAFAERRAWTLGLTLTGLALAVWLAAAVIWRTRHDVALAVSAAGAIRDGDLQAQTVPGGRDELGDIGRALDGARARLQELLGSVHADTTVLQQASAALGAVSAELRTGALQSASRTDVVALSAREVSEGVQSVSDGTAQMVLSVQEISSTTNAALAVTAEAMRMAELANDSVAELEHSSAEISTVLSLIGSIAAQTNLLALNATIEAARAGDYGKGFAVVANEVKQLAQQTAAATGEVGRQVTAIQADAAGAVTALSRMRDITAQIDSHQGTIAAAVEEQTVASSGITRSLADAADGSRVIAETVETVAHAAGRTNESAERTAGAASSVTDVSDRLSDQLGAFTY